MRRSNPRCPCHIEVQRASGIWGSNEISPQVIHSIIVPYFKEFLFRRHYSIEVTKRIKNLGVKTKSGHRFETQMLYLSWKSSSSGVLVRRLCLQCNCNNKLVLSARAHSWEAAWNVIVRLLLNFNTYIFTSSWGLHWASRTRWRASSRGGKRQVFVIKLGFSRGGSDAALWET